MLLKYTIRVYEGIMIYFHCLNLCILIVRSIALVLYLNL
jgi:hypothetical protein